MIRVVRKDGKPVEEKKFTITVVTDPEEIAKSREVAEHADRNSDWLQSHWPELLPQALGKHVAVAGQQAFLADTVAEAIALARAAHPDDKGIMVRYVSPHRRPLIYGIRR